MRQTVDPNFEFSWRPALWAAGALLLVSGVGVVLYGNLRFFGYGTVCAGLAAALRSGYYENSGNNAVIGVLLVSLFFVPLLLFAGVLFGLGLDVRSAAVAATGLGLGWMAVVAIGFVPVAYLSAILGDFIRRKVGGPIGYSTK